MKKIRLISFILLIIFVIFSFLPAIYRVTSYEYIGFDEYVEKWSHLESYSGSIIYSGAFDAIISLLCLVSACVGIIVLVLQYRGKQSSVLDKLIISPIITAISYFVTTMYNILPEEAPDSYSQVGYLGVNAGWGFYIEAALIIAVTVMCIIILKNESEDSFENKEN